MSSWHKLVCRFPAQMTHKVGQNSTSLGQLPLTHLWNLAVQCPMCLNSKKCSGT